MLLEKAIRVKRKRHFIETRIRCGSHEFYDDLIYNLRATFNAFVVWYGL